MAKPIEYRIATYTTKKPSGLTISRNGNRFTFGWKIGDKDYGGGQLLQYSINGGDWIGKTVKKTDTAAYIDVNFSQYYPSTLWALRSVSFRVSGVRAPFRVRKEGKKKIVMAATQCRRLYEL